MYNDLIHNSVFGGFIPRKYRCKITAYTHFKEKNQF